MPIVAKDTRREFEPCPEGLHHVVCVDVVDLGMRPTQWGEKHKVEIRWQTSERMKDGQRYLLIARFTNSLNEKARLCQQLEVWRGRKFTGEEKMGFDLEKLIGVNGQAQVTHNLGDNDRVYANVQAIVPVARGMGVLAPENYTRVCEREAVEAEPIPEEDSVPF